MLGGIHAQLAVVAVVSLVGNAAQAQSEYARAGIARPASVQPRGACPQLRAGTLPLIVAGTMAGGAAVGGGLAGLIFVGAGGMGDSDDLAVGGLAILGAAAGYTVGAAYGASLGARMSGARTRPAPVMYASAAGVLIGAALIAKGLPPGAAVLVHTGITSAVAYRSSHARVPLDTADGETCPSIP